MRENTRIGLMVLAVGLLLGLLGDLLLRATPWGANLLLWVGALVAAMVALARIKRIDLGREGRWLLPCALAAAAAFAWRASPALLALDMFLLLVMLALTLLRARGGRVHRTGVTVYALACVVSALSAVFAPLALLFSDIGWKEVPREGWSRHALSIARGLLIAAPLVIVFGALFMAADAAYEGLVLSVLNFDAEIVASHVLLFVFFGWVSAGYLCGAFLGREDEAGGVSGERYALSVFGFGSSERAASHTSKAGNVSGGDVSRTGASESVNFRNVTEFKSVTEDDAPAHGFVNLPTQPASVTEERVANEESHDEKFAERDDASASAGSRREGAAGVARPAGEARADSESKEAGASSMGAGASSSVSGGRLRDSVVALRERVSLGVVEIGVVLGLLNALFLSFVLVQFRYFFGGADFVLTPDGPTYADYARRGFFELVWVAALVLPLLLASHWLLRKELRSHVRVFQGLAMGLLVMLFVIMASALGRMRLYQSEYGLTELRLYTTAFMFWLAVVFVWFALTVLRGRRELFACGALVAALGAVAALHALNPDAHIVRTNAALAREGRAFDARYAASLDADAVPALLEVISDLNADERRIIAAELLDDYGDARGDWRSWNWSRARAARVVREREAMLKEWARTTDGAQQQQQPPPQ